MKRFSFTLCIGILFSAVSGACAHATDDNAFNTPYMPYAAFDALPATEIKIGDATVILAFAPGELALPKTDIATWVERCARTVAAYYGRFPVNKYRLLIMPAPGRGVRGGTTFGYRGAATKLRLGQSADMSQLMNDWVLIHEMIHTAFPSLRDQHHWLEEGLATYVESVARVQAGGISAAEAWGGWIRGMPNGLPASGDEGLDNTHTWGRTYWGGALFCLVADIRIRERTANRYGLQDAARAIVNEGGNIEQDWPVMRALLIGDRATGTHVLEELYGEMSTRAVDPDLDAIWKNLGVKLLDGRVVFDDKAPQADIRRAITALR